MPSPSSSGDEGRPPTPTEPRRVVVAHRLPLLADPNPDAPHGFDFSLDPQALPLQLSHGFPRPVVFVGVLPSAVTEAVPASDELAADLLARFSCYPVFVSAKVHADFYDGFCKHYLWPVLHYLLPLAPSYGTGGGLPFNNDLYRTFLTVNTQFAERVFELLNPDEDLVFVHDYHLWAFPTFLRHKSPSARIGFFLHSPFPTSELFRAIPVREDLLRALLNADLVGFHTFDYARHFLSSCSRVLGLSNRSSRGYIGIEYYGRTVVVKILSVGIDMGQLRAVLPLPETVAKSKEIVDKYRGRWLMLGVDDMDLFKGIGLKLLAMERLLESRANLRGQVVLVQINNPARSLGRDVDEVHAEVLAIRDRINGRFGWEGYEPVVVIDGAMPMHDKVAFYTSADICVVNAVRDGLNRIPYFYTVCRQEGPVPNASSGKPRQSTIIVSEFVGCSPSLSGAIRINPWNVDDVADAMNTALKMSNTEQRLRQEKHYRYVSTHDVVYWAQSFDQDLQKASKDNSSMVMLSFGLSMSFRVVALGPNFQKLSPDHIDPAYRQTGNRLILLDYDGTVMPQGLINKEPSEKVIRTLNALCSDPANTVFVVSGRGKDELAKWFAPCERMGISAEHGYFTRWSRDSPWESCKLVTNFDWKNIAEPVMKHYTDATDGSYIEVKETSLVWHYEEADPDFGSCQAKELQDHLQNVLANEPVYVKSGHQIVEINPQGVGKGVAVRSLISTIGDRGSLPDFILCVGDDRSDEDMFEAMSSSAFPETTQIFPCTVGNKPSSAKYYLDDPEDVLKMLQGLKTDSSIPQHPAAPVTFENPLE
ncbi:probable alpha,alpha-trehalose-phosphate synthase [UDP-forming] 9 [Oryza brachyantha]|uniref:Trehalose 6-phosphate phosphatase n=1 Tax=Oryza brachyantha TaxID=4533 RepID=J3MTG3_ORYBR|nr:probable alpha,alpha-trehalose-phosphate synthase [UDP-forming] 9 [Oryza brachyantha]